jgi:hypothetical protein
MGESICVFAHHDNVYVTVRYTWGVVLMRGLMAARGCSLGDIVLSTAESMNSCSATLLSATPGTSTAPAEPSAAHHAAHRAMQR